MPKQNKENSVIEAEFTTIQERTLPVIATEILMIEKQVAKVTLEGAIEIGRRLNEAKEKLNHGEFNDWCMENLNYSKRNAERFMQLANNYGDADSEFSKATALSQLSISKALKLLQLPEEEVENFIEEHDVPDMSVRELEEEIKNLKSEKDELQKDLTFAEKKATDAEGKLGKEKEKIDKLKYDIEVIKNSQQEEIDKAVAESREQAYAEGKIDASDELKEVTEANVALHSENENLKLKLENSGTLQTLNANTNIMQEAFGNALEAIKDTADKEMSNKMTKALDTVLADMKKRLEA